MLISRRVRSAPAAYCTIRSVPPAIGIHRSPSAVISASALCKSDGATRLNSAGSDLIEPPRASRPPPPLPESAHIRCNGTNFPPTLRECRPSSARVLRLADGPRRESCPACRFRTAHRRIPETRPVRLARAHRRPVLRLLLRLIPAPGVLAPGSYPPARHP